MKSIHELHVSLRSLKNNYKLAAKTKGSVTPQVEQDTHWSSGYYMVESFFEVLPYLADAVFNLNTFK